MVVDWGELTVVKEVILYCLPCTIFYQKKKLFLLRFTSAIGKPQLLIVKFDGRFLECINFSATMETLLNPHLWNLFHPPFRENFKRLKLYKLRGELKDYKLFRGIYHLMALYSVYNISLYNFIKHVNFSLF